MVARTAGMGHDAGSSRVRRTAVAAGLAIAGIAATTGAVVAGSPPNDAFRDARTVAFGSLVEQGTTGATTQPNEPEPSCAGPAGASVWFRFTPAEDGDYAVDTFLSTYDTIVAVYKGAWLGGLKEVACSDDAGGPTSYAIFTGTAGVRYSIAVSGYQGSAGDLQLFLDHAPDASPPIVRPPVSTVRVGARLGEASLTRWRARDPESGVASSELQLSVDGGPFRTIALESPDARHTTHLLYFGETARYRVRATNGQDVRSRWRTGPAFVPTLIEEDDGSLRYSGTWRSRRTSSASGGATRWSTEPGATVSTTFEGQMVALVAPVGPARGEVRVRIDGVLEATLDLGAAERAPRSVIFARTFRDAGRHTLRLEVVGTPGRPRVDLDAIDIHVDAGD